MLFWYKRNLHDNNDREKCRGYIDKIYQKNNDIKVTLFPDRLEIKKFNIIIPFSSMNNRRKGALIRRIIGEISETTGIPEDDILIIRDI
jgi:hypothetical protein